MTTHAINDYPTLVFIQGSVQGKTSVPFILHTWIPTTWYTGKLHVVIP